MNDVTTILRAAAFAAVKHREQRRKNGDIPYVNHPLAVATSLAELAGVTDVTALAAAVLHDTLEDTATTFAELEREFGAPIAGVVRECTDDKSLPKVERKRQQIEHGPHLSPAARLVKLADKLDNLRELRHAPPPSWDEARIRGYFVWGHAVVSAIGNQNDALWRELHAVFDGVVPGDAGERERELQRYYATLAQRED